MRCEEVSFKIKNKVHNVQSKGYYVAGKSIPEVKAELKRLLDEGIIEYSRSYYSSPAFIVRKKNNKVRLVLDYKKMNEFLYDDAYQIPNIEYNIRNMGENRFFSTIDLKNGFNQIPLSYESRKYTAFMVMGQQYQYKMLPFGIKPVPKIFQRQLAEILRNIENCFVYIDAIVIYSKSEKNILCCWKKYSIDY
ncbi:Retrovirus-related Pol polyprotein from transposon [Nosema granulosis]|uniref:Retrovirus-related Pol polyprotein from transposon n=1 Tax=Nosema granulosis TaxID=83296 RepID=A0A9P6KWY5_9MICR|nr:Retrovirus-related Pol polyprotein from transposon [Nosema granulosis]